MIWPLSHVSSGKLKFRNYQFQGWTKNSSWKNSSIIGNQQMANKMCGKIVSTTNNIFWGGIEIFYFQVEKQGLSPLSYLVVSLSLPYPLFPVILTLLENEIWLNDFYLEFVKNVSNVSDVEILVNEWVTAL